MKNMDKAYIYLNSHHDSQRDWAVVVLPEIYGLHPFIRKTVDDFAEEFGVVALALDHLYAGTGQSERYDYQTGAAAGMAAMQQVTGAAYLDLLGSLLEELQRQYPAVRHVAVCGFCFGGRLAFLSGVDKRVERIISFYGAGPHAPFYNGLGCVEALTTARAHDTKLKVLALYGGQDNSIPVDDRTQTEKLLHQAGIAYQADVYDDAGHAFANYERSSYNPAAAQAAWLQIGQFLSDF